MGKKPQERCVDSRQARSELPVSEWVHELYRERFRPVPDPEPLSAPVPVEVDLNEEAARRFEEQLYWEDYWERNEDDTQPKKRKGSQAKPGKAPDGTSDS